MASDDRHALLDRLVAEYADRVAAGRGAQRDDLLAGAPAEVRAELVRLFDLIALDEEAPREPIAPLVPGLALGGCRLVAEIGRGGMATVWRARQEGLGRDVALKVLRPGLALDPRHAQRFRREALAIARVDHRNLVRIHAVGREHGHLFLVMELVEGGSLAQLLASLPPPRERAPEQGERPLARLFAEVARGLAAAHARGIVHRDVKPSNVLLRRDGTPVVADFGLAKGDGDLASSLTGEPVGTPYYMSPEQVEQSRARVDARTDVYSLGVALYEALAGRRPFDGATTIALFDAIRHELPPPLRALNPACSAAAERVVAQAMARDPAGRYASAAALADDLEALAEGRPVGAARRPAGRLFARLAFARARGVPYEQRSVRRWLGMPLLHVAFGPPGRPATARGVVAIGDRAVGLLAIGNVARGVVAIGNFSFGLVAAGACAAGGASFGGLALGALALGGCAVGGLALGGCAVGYAAIGGLAIGWYGLGGKAIAVEAVTNLEASEAALQFFRRISGFVSRLLPSLRTTLDEVLRQR